MTAGLDQTLTDLLRTHERVRPDATALQLVDNPVTYGELASDAWRLAEGLRSIGIGPGDVVAGQLPNSREFVTAFLAVAARGAIFQSLHMPYRRKELVDLLGHSRASAVFVSAVADGGVRVAEVLSLASTLPNLRDVIAVGDAAGNAGANAGANTADLLAYSELLSSTPTSDTVATTSPDDPYLLLYTSGTTGGPKGVVHTYRRFVNNGIRSAIELNIGESDRVLSLAPLTHLYGLFTLHLSLTTGSTAALVPAFDPSKVLNELVVLKPTDIFAAPAHLAPFVAKQVLAPQHFEQTKMVCLSGATVPVELSRAIDTLMPDGSVIQLWGMTELQAGTYGRPSDPYETRMKTAGRASPMTELRTDGPSGEEGALEVRGPSVFTEYLDNPSESRDAFTADGWFRTGDLALIDNDGYITLTGRTKEIINRGGVKFNPVEVEAVILQLPAIAQCAIVPAPDPMLGERAVLCAQLMPESSLSLKDVTELLDEAGLAKNKWPERLEVFDELPMTPTKKVMRGSLVKTVLVRMGDNQ